MPQEFGDCGCMDAAYALGLWRAGSTFQVVADAKITHVDLALSSQVTPFTGQDRVGLI